MLRLQRYLLKELLSAFGLILTLVTSVMFVVLLIRFLRDFPEVGLVAAAKAAPMIASLALPITMPLSFLVACLLTYGRFTDENEYLAMRMGGIHPWHAVAPTLLVGLALSLVAMPLNASVVPVATLARKTIGRDRFVQLSRALLDPALSSAELGRGSQIVWQGRDGEWLTDVTLSGLRLPRDKESKGGAKDDGDAAPRGLFAEKARISLDPIRDEIVIELQDLRFQSVDAIGNVRTLTEEYRWFTVSFEQKREETNRNTSEMRTTELLYRLHHGDAALAELEREAADARRPAEEAASRGKVRSAVNFLRKCRVEYWRRIALSLAPLAFALFGAPLGLVSGRGSRAAALVTALVVALPVYYPLLELGTVLGRAGTLPAGLAMNLGNLLLFGAAGYLLHRTFTR